MTLKDELKILQDQRVLTSTAYKIFQERDLLNTFKIDDRQVFVYFVFEWSAKSSYSRYNTFHLRTLLSFLMTIEDHYLKVGNIQFNFMISPSLDPLLLSPSAGRKSFLWLKFCSKRPNLIQSYQNILDAHYNARGQYHNPQEFIMGSQRWMSLHIFLRIYMP